LILQAINVSRRFGGLKAVDDLSLAVEERSVHAIIGPNGAGKTTFFNLVSGAIPADSGRVVFAGQDVTGRSPEDLVRLGLVRTFQRASIFEEFTAAENVALAIRSRLGRNVALHMSRAAERLIEDEACAILADVGLAGREFAPAGALAHGSQRALDIGIALASRPRLILMDEPLAGMSRGDRPRIATLIRQLRDVTGLAVVLVEHDIGMVMQLSDRIAVLQRGRLIADGLPAEIRENAAVRKAYLQGSFAA
jgi:branched-chain amino acid transport system ATP-binding protein